MGNNNIIQLLECPAEIVSGRTFVPLRFVSETLGAQVQWNALTKMQLWCFLPLFIAKLANFDRFPYCTNSSECLKSKYVNKPYSRIEANQVQR